MVVEDYDLETIGSRMVWVPKSQLSNEGHPSYWITEEKARSFYSFERRHTQYEATWYDATGRKIEPQATAKEAEIADRRIAKAVAAKKAYNDLLDRAKAMGVKGVRKGMKRKTIEEKIRNHKG